MRNETSQKQPAPAYIWIISMVCMAAVLFALFGGAAFAGIRQARLTAARASCGQIEAVLNLAEIKAEQGGLGQRPASYTDLLKSYDTAAAATLTAYERYVLQAMLESFGNARCFDFAVARTEDSGGVHTQIYLFPTRGRTDIRTDHYYRLVDTVLTEYNG